MAIQIEQNLTATPNPTALPRRIEFRQTLVSDQPTETVTVLYSLDPAHEVWFLDSASKLTKTITRTDVVSDAGTLRRDRINLQRGPGQGPMALVQIDQTVTDSTGVPLADVCVLQLQ